MDIAVVDDEKAIREHICALIEEQQPWSRIEAYPMGEELLASGKRFDIVFLDIQMDGMNGIEATRNLREQQGDTVLIFITGIKDYVFDALDLYAFQYLLKPIDEDKFAEVLERAMREAGRKKERRVLFIKSRNLTLDQSEILHIESRAKKVEIHTVRHTRAMRLYQHGMDLTLISQWLGHKQLETTLDAHADTEAKRKAITEAMASDPFLGAEEEYGKTLQSYNDIENFVIGVLTPDAVWDQSVLYQLEDEQARDLYSIYEKNLQEMAGKYGETPEQQLFLAEQYGKTELPFAYESKNSWDTMLMYVETYGMILAIVIGFLAAGIFAEEFRSRADAVFFSARYGRTKAARHKVLAGLLMATIVYWAGMGILSLVSLGVMGISGFSTPYQIDQPYSIYNMTFGEYYLLAVLCGYIASLLAASVTMLIAAKMRSANVAVCVPFFLFCVMPFIGRAFSAFLTFFKLTPDMLLNVIECAKDPNVFQMGNVVFRQIPCIVLLYFVISIILLPFVYRNYHCYGLKK